MTPTHLMSSKYDKVLVKILSNPNATNAINIVWAKLAPKIVNSVRFVPWLIELEIIVTTVGPGIRINMLALIMNDMYVSKFILPI